MTDRVACSHLAKGPHRINTADEREDDVALARTPGVPSRNPLRRVQIGVEDVAIVCQILHPQSTSARSEMLWSPYGDDGDRVGHVSPLNHCKRGHRVWTILSRRVVRGKNLFCVSILILSVCAEGTNPVSDLATRGCGSMSVLTP